MTKIKLDSSVSTSASFALEPLAGKLYASPGIRIVGVVELAHVERTQPAPDTDKEPSVKMRVTALEIARDEQEDSLRRAMRALYMHRSATSWPTLTTPGRSSAGRSTRSRGCLTTRSREATVADCYAFDETRLWLSEYNALWDRQRRRRRAYRRRCLARRRRR